MVSRHINPDLTAEQLRTVLDYDPKTGVFRWRWRDDVPAHINKRDAGKIAGYVHRPTTGHMKIGLNGSAYFLHRLAWLYVTGTWPKKDIDHIDNNPGNNAWTNLREATQSQNSQNMKTHKTVQDELPRLKGARFHRTTRRWQASIVVNGKSIYLGLFPTQALAHAAYCEAATRLHGQFARFS